MAGACLDKTIRRDRKRGNTEEIPGFASARFAEEPRAGRWQLKRTGPNGRLVLARSKPKPYVALYWWEQERWEQKGERGLKMGLPEPSWVFGGVWVLPARSSCYRLSTVFLDSSFCRLF